MELDELKAAWQLLDRRVERLDALEWNRQRQSRLAGVQRNLRRLLVGQGLQLLTGVTLCLIFAPYWVAHRAEAHWLICGLALHGYGALMIAFAIRSMVLIRRVDHGKPVLAIARRMAALARWKLSIEWPVFAVTGCFMWIPLTLVLFGSVGADLWRDAPMVVASFGVSGLVCLALVGFAWRLMLRVGPDAAIDGWATRLRASAIGSRVMQAQAELAELERFERD